MNKTFYGFKPVALTTLEFAYNLDLSISHKYFQISREAYPFPIYIKISNDNKILESYPLYIRSGKNSIDIIEKNIKYLGYFDMNHYAYLSWDMKNEPNEIYLPKGSKYIEKYKDDKLDAKYYTIYDLSELDEHKLLSDEIKEFARKEKPDVFMYVIKNNELKKFYFIFNFMNEKYLEKLQLFPMLKNWN